MKRLISGSLALCVLFCISALCFAEGGDGTGGGTGGGKSGQFAFVSSSVSDGSNNVNVNVTIDLEFNKNVVNISVKESNKSCFTLVDSKGNSVAFTVEMGDDQTNPTDIVKRHIHINPNKALSPSTQYTLTISKNLQAKNGSYLYDNPEAPNDVVIKFTTATAATTTKAAVTTAKPRVVAPAKPTTATTADATTVTTAATTRAERTRRTTTAKATTAANATTIRGATATTKAVSASAATTTAVTSTAVTVPDKVFTLASPSVPVVEIETITETTTVSLVLEPTTAQSVEPESRRHVLPAVLMAVGVSAAVAIICGIVIVKRGKEKSI